MPEQLVSQPDHGENIIDILNGNKGVASPRLQLFFDDITRLLGGLTSESGGSISPSSFDPSSFLYRPSTGTDILNATINELEFVGRLQGGEIEGLSFTESWSILGNGTGDVTINEPGFSRDFRVESNSSGTMIMVDGSADIVGFSDSGDIPTDGVVHIQRGSVIRAAASAQANLLVLESSGPAGMTIRGAEGFPAVIAMGTEDVETWRDGWEAIIKFGRDANIGAFQNVQGFSLNTNLYEQPGVSGNLWTRKTAGFASELVLQPHTNHFFMIDTGAAGATVDHATVANKINFERSQVRFNEFALDVDFFIYGNTNTNLFRLDGGSSVLTMGTASKANAFYANLSAGNFGISRTGALPQSGSLLHLRSAAAGVAASTSADDLIVEGTGQVGISILSDAAGFSNLYYGRPGAEAAGRAEYTHSTDTFNLWSANIKRITMTNAGVIINEDGNSTTDFRHESDTNTHLFFCDATGAGRVGISNASIVPTDGLLHIHKGGTAGTVTASTLADGVVIESNAGTGLSILVPNDGSSANVYFGAPTSGNNAGRVSMVPSTGIMTITATQVNISNNLGFAGRLDANTVTVTGITHTAGNEHAILVDDDTAGAAVTVTLPTAATANTIYHIKKLGSTASVTVDGNGAELIDGGATAVLTVQYESITVISDGSAWWVL